MRFAMLALLCAAGSAVGEEAKRPDILVADFEGDTWGDWKATGDAFGAGPVRGTLPGQMPVTGYQGKGLVNSFVGGDKSTGTLTSPEFTIQRKFLNFLIGGGKHPGKTCMDLLVAGRVVRTATGPNDKPGGSERLEWESWDVGDLAGKTAVLRIVDDHTGGWGHINVDHIVQSDRRAGSAVARREIAVTTRYLHLPVKTGAAKRRVKVEADGKVVHDFDIELADGEPTFRAFLDVSAFKGQTLRVETTLPFGSTALDGVTQSDELPDTAGLYAEKLRPQFHFTARRGWLNDPNGLVHFAGEWHLFFQHNPYGWDWGNMHWGHAVSKDLIHWKELPEALYPQRHGDWAFSGSAVVDVGNTSYFSTTDGPPLVLAYTSTGRGECIAYSNDKGRTWSEHLGNPVVKHQGRDPRLLRHAASKQWVMAVYDESEGKKWIAFHTSPDLKTWTYRSKIEGFFECPDLFELPVDGDAKNTKWVLYAADGKYVPGSFDGAEFKADGPKLQTWFGNFYAAQTFSDAPDGRRIQIGWANGVVFPGMPFNQQMTVPVVLSLRTTADGIRMFAEPAAELASLRGARQAFADVTLKPNEKPAATGSGELLDVVAELEVGTAEAVGLNVRGIAVTYDAKKGELSCKGRAAPLKLADGRLRLRVLVDRGSLEIFADAGRDAMSVAAIPAAAERAIEPFARGGEAKLKSLEVFELKSAWKE